MLDSLKKPLPVFLHRFLPTGFPTLLEKICSFYLARQKFLNWQVEQAKWVFGADSLNELLHKCRSFDETIAYQQLHTDCLVLLAKKDNYYDYQLGLNFFQKIPAQKKKKIIFNKQDFSTDLHCQNGSAYDANDQIFQWLLE